MDAEPVRLVDHEESAALLARRGQLHERGGVAQHRVDGLDQDHRPPVARRGECAAYGGDVVVRHDRHVGAREADRVDERGVHVGVGDDEGVAVGERRDDAEVGVVAGREDQGRGLPQVGGDLALEVGVQVERTGDQA